MKDFLDQELAIGDAVIINDKRYSNIALAKIVKFTPTMMRAEVYDHHWGKGWSGETVLCHSGQVIKADPELVTAWLLKRSK